MDLGDTLNYRTLTKTVQKFQFPELKLAKFFPAVPISGDTAEWDILDPTRTKGDFTTGAAFDTSQETVGHQAAKCLRQFRSVFFRGQQLNNIRKIGSTEKDSVGRTLIARNQENVTRIITRTEEWMRSAALTGTLAATVDKIALSIDYGIPVGNKPTAGTSWAIKTTDIMSDIATWKQLITQGSGQAPAIAICNYTVMSYLMKNDYVLSALGGSLSAEQIFKTGYISDLAGLSWFQYDDGYLNAAGTFIPYVANDKLLIVPNPGAWADMAEGTEVIPADGDDLQEATGIWSYADIEKNPSALVLFVGKVSLPRINVPKAIVYAETTP